MKSDRDEDQRATEGGTLRKDGTRRKERKVRPGYQPPGAVQVYVPRYRRERGEDGSRGPRSLADLTRTVQAPSSRDTRAEVDGLQRDIEKKLQLSDVKSAQDDDEPPPGFTRRQQE